MALDWSGGELAAGLSCYRHQKFFEAHEHWECVWNELKDPEKSFLQGLIQVTVAMHHYQHANQAGALSLLQRALQRLERCPERFGGVDIATLATDVREWLRVLERAAASIPAFPGIHLIDPAVE
jgi:predicted metal-dependent hydrolase